MKTLKEFMVENSEFRITWRQDKGAPYQAHIISAPDVSAATKKIGKYHSIKNITARCQGTKADGSPCQTWGVMDYCPKHQNQAGKKKGLKESRPDYKAMYAAGHSDRASKTHWGVFSKAAGRPEAEKEMRKILNGNNFPDIADLENVYVNSMSPLSGHVQTNKNHYSFVSMDGGKRMNIEKTDLATFKANNARQARTHNI